MEPVARIRPRQGPRLLERGAIVGTRSPRRPRHGHGLQARVELLVDSLNRASDTSRSSECDGARRCGGSTLTRLAKDLLARYRKLEAFGRKWPAADLQANRGNTQP